MPAIIVGTAAIATQAEILRMSLFCCTRDLARRWALEDVGEQPVVGLDVVDHPQQVVGDVAEQQPHLLAAATGDRDPSCSIRSGAARGTAARRNSSTSRLSR